MTWIGSLVLVLFAVSECSGQQGPVRAELAKTTAWTGEPVPLIITLYSPGPFSGTASFDLPAMPRTAFLTTGSPLVGNEEVDGQSYFTQRHELKLYTQLSGEITIPAFQVRFAGKKTFTSEAEPMEGATSELRFESKRPPGTEAMGIVVSATSMSVGQSWTPDLEDKLQAGDVIVRTITRTAEGTTAMMLSPVSDEAPEGVQVYTGQAQVEDKTERGESSSLRIDTLKYQFRRSGSVKLPKLAFVWWDPKKEELQQETLPGETVRVAEATARPPTSEAVENNTSFGWGYAALGLLVFSVLAWVLRKPLSRVAATCQAYHQRPDRVAVRELRTACANDNASAAYSALMKWFDALRTGDDWTRIDESLAGPEHRALNEQRQTLSRQLFGAKADASDWNGKLLWTAFRQSQHRVTRRRSPIHAPELPPLNPTA